MRRRSSSKKISGGLVELLVVYVGAEVARVVVHVRELRVAHSLRLADHRSAHALEPGGALVEGRLDVRTLLVAHASTSVPSMTG